MGLMDLSPIGFQSQLFLGLISQVRALTVGVPIVGCEPFTPQEEALGLRVPS